MVSNTTRWSAHLAQDGPERKQIAHEKNRAERPVGLEKAHAEPVRGRLTTYHAPANTQGSERGVGVWRCQLKGELPTMYIQRCFLSVSAAFNMIPSDLNGEGEKLLERNSTLPSSKSAVAPQFTVVV